MRDMTSLRIGGRKGRTDANNVEFSGRWKERPREFWFHALCFSEGEEVEFRIVSQK